MSNSEETKKESKCEDCKCECEKGDECCGECKCEDGKCEDCKECECECEDEKCECCEAECGSCSDDEKLKADLIQEKGERLALLAEFVNYKKRADAEKADFMVYANNVLLKQIIEIVDDFDRAIKGTESKEEGLAEGVKMIHKKIGSLVASYGLEEIEVKVGDEFSPTNMEAITTVEVKDKKQHNKVVEVLQKGYTNRQTGKVFKNAVVVIGKK